MNISPGTSMWTLLPRWWQIPFKDEVVESINGARSVAVNILGPKSEPERRLFLQPPEIDMRKDKFKAHKMLFVYGAESSGGDDALGFGTRWIVGVASFMLGNISAPLTGSDLSWRRFAVGELARVDEELADLSQYRQHQKRSLVAKATAEMLMHERRIFSIIKMSAEMTLVLRITLVVTAVISFTGAMLTLPNLVVMGSVGMFGSACVMLLKTGFDSTSFQIRREASVMRRYLDYVLNASWFFGVPASSYPNP
jgi:hypothetical protein